MNEKLWIKNKKKKQELVSLLKYSQNLNDNGDDDVQITVGGNGTSGKLSTATLNCASRKLVRDYSNQKTGTLAVNTVGGTYDIAGKQVANDDGLLMFDSNGDQNNPYYADGITVKNLLKNSYTFLKQMKDSSIRPNLTYTVPRYIAYDLPDNYNGRKYASKNEIASDDNGYGNTFLKVLRNIGLQNLKNAIDDSSLTLSANEKKKMKGYAEEIIDYINTFETIDGRGAEITDDFDYVAYEKRYNEKNALFASLKNTEYPYRPIPDYEKIIEFMAKVFPETNSSFKYLNDPSSSVYLKPDNGKSGWEEIEGGLKINGWEINGAGVSGVTITDGTLVKYGEENKSSKPDIFGQNKPYILNNNLDFKSLVNIWWGVFKNFINANVFTNTFEWKAVGTTNSGIDVTYDENNLIVDRLQLRYIKTIREIAKAIGITSEISEFDYLFSDIASKASKQAWGEERGGGPENLLDKKLTVEDYQDNSLQKAIVDRRVWKDITSGDIDFSYLEEIIEQEEVNANADKSEADRLDGQISDVEKEENEIEIKIRELQDNINSWQLLLDGFDDAPVEKQKEQFAELYAKKDSQEGLWTWVQLEQLESLLGKIKEKLGDSEFSSQNYQEKLDEVNGIMDDDDVKKHSSKITGYGSLGNTDVEKIKKILESDDNGLDLDEFITAFEGYAVKVKLSDSQENSLKNLKEAKQDPNKFKDVPTSDLTEDKLKAIVGFDVEKALLDKWKAKIDGKTLSEAEIKDIVGAYAESKDKVKYKAIIGHLQENGVEGKANSKVSGSDDAKIWKDFLEKNTPSEVIKTIVVHENEDILKDSPDEDKKKKKIEEMRNDSAAGYNDDKKENKFKKDRYGDPTAGEESKVTREQLLNYLYDKKISNVQKSDKSWEENGDDPSTPTNTEDTKGEKSWLPWKFSKDNIGRPLTSLILILLLVFGGVAAIFWKKISEWWNGPAEEEGKVGEESDKEEVENE